MIIKLLLHVKLVKNVNITYNFVVDSLHVALIILWEILNMTNIITTWDFSSHMGLFIPQIIKVLSIYFYRLCLITRCTLVFVHRIVRC